MLVFGGENTDDKEVVENQISEVKDCALERTGSLPFRLINGACTVLEDNNLFLCFGDKDLTNSTCWRSKNLQSQNWQHSSQSIYGHTSIKIATSHSLKKTLAVGAYGLRGHAQSEWF